MTDKEYQETNKLIASVARGYAHRAEWNDLMQAGWVGALTARRRYRPDGHMKVSTFTVWYIKHAIRDCVTTKGGAPLPAEALPEALETNDMSTQRSDALQYLHALFTPEELALLLLYYKGYNFREIGELYGHSSEWARSHIKTLLANVEARQ